VDLVINDYTGNGQCFRCLPGGTTTLTWIVLDIYGNVNFCTQDITVLDDENSEQSPVLLTKRRLLMQEFVRLQ